MALHRKHCSQSFFRVKVIGSDNWYRLARHSRRHLPLESLIIDQEYLLLHQKVLYIANSHRCFAVFPSRIRYYFPTTYSIWASPLTLFDNRMKPEGLRVSSEPEPQDILMFLLLLFWNTVNMWICLGLHNKKTIQSNTAFPPEAPNL